MEAATIGHLPAPPRLSREEVRERAHERRRTLLAEAEEATRGLDLLKRLRRARETTAARALTWRDAERALYDHAAHRIEVYERAVRACAPKAAA